MANALLHGREGDPIDATAVTAATGLIQEKKANLLEQPTLRAFMQIDEELQTYGLAVLYLSKCAQYTEPAEALSRGREYVFLERNRMVQELVDKRGLEDPEVRKILMYHFYLTYMDLCDEIFYGYPWVAPEIRNDIMTTLVREGVADGAQIQALYNQSVHVAGKRAIAIKTAVKELLRIPPAYEPDPLEYPDYAIHTRAATVQAKAAESRNHGIAAEILVGELMSETCKGLSTEDTVIFVEKARGEEDREGVDFILLIRRQGQEPQVIAIVDVKTIASVEGASDFEFTAILPDSKKVGTSKVRPAPNAEMLQVMKESGIPVLAVRIPVNAIQTRGLVDSSWAARFFEQQSNFLAKAALEAVLHNGKERKEDASN